MTFLPLKFPANNMIKLLLAKIVSALNWICPFFSIYVTSDLTELYSSLFCLSLPPLNCYQLQSLRARSDCD